MISTATPLPGPAHSPAQRWLADRLPSFVLLGLASIIATLTTIGTMEWWSWEGRPFPGFFVMESGVVPTVGLYHWTGLVHGVPFHSRVVTVDGRAVVSNGDVYNYVDGLPDGTPVTYTLEKDGRVETRVVPTMRFRPLDYALTLGLFLVNGAVALAGAATVSLLRPRLPASRAFLALGIMWGLFPITGTTLYHPDLAWMSRLHYLTQATFPATFIHLGLVFPVEREFVRRRPWLLGLPYLMSALITAWIFVSYYASPPSVRPLHAAYWYASFALPVFLTLLAYTWWENRTPLARPRTWAILIGGVLGGGAAIYGFVNTAQGGGDFPINFMAITPFLFFGSIAYAIVAHEAFEITRVLRRTALYFLLTVLLAGAYLGGVMTLGWVLPERLERSPAVAVAVAALVGLLFQPLRTALQNALDRIFYRGRIDYQETVGRVSTALPSLLQLDQILDRVGRTLYDGFPLENVAVCLWLPDCTRLWQYDMRSEGMVERAAPLSFTGLRAALTDASGQPLALVDPESDLPLHASLELERATLGAVLAVPLCRGLDVIGAVTLGPKRSGQAFDRDDVALLDTLTSQCAVAVHNALSYEEVQRVNHDLESLVRDRTRDLEQRNADLQSAQEQLVQNEKMASLGQLVAGVAHELNNPLSFVAGNIAPMRERLRALREVTGSGGDLTATRLVDQLDRSLDIIARGADRTAKIVGDLRTFSRAGDVVPEPCDVHEIIDFNLTLLKERWQGRITIARRFGQIPLIEAVASQLGQVFMNLLANACDAVPGSGTITISTQADATSITVNIADTGQGMDASTLRRIYDPFFTTKPQGHGTGLGLSIVRGIIESHRGEIHVESVVGVGTTLRIRLPIQASIA